MGPDPDTVRSTMRVATVVLTVLLSIGAAVAPADAAGRDVPLRDDWMVASVTGGLPDGFAAGLAAVPGVEHVSVVSVGNAPVVEVRDADGWATDRPLFGFTLPIDLHAIDPATHEAFVTPPVAAALHALGPDEVLLGRSSARLRGIGAGGALILADGTRLRVAGIVDDRWVGAAEAVTTRSDATALGVVRPRYAVFRYDGARYPLELALGGLTDRAFRVDVESAVGTLRHGVAVRPQVAFKLEFGEFAFRPAEGRHIEIEPGWVRQNIVTGEVPLLGRITCHRRFLPSLRLVLAQLEVTGVGDIIEPRRYLGCFSARFITGRRDLSHHAWGAATDLNFGNTRPGPGSAVDPRLLEAMTGAGITSGHDWSNPDPGHFEWFGAGN
jgi:hypothetical protein